MSYFPEARVLLTDTSF